MLGLLRDGKPRHGYALMKAYRAVSDRKISTGNFYRELGRLLADGCVETAERPQDGDPRRAPYRITPQGTSCFDEWFAAPLGSDAERVDDLALRLVVLARTPPDTLGQSLERWKDDLWLHVKLLEKSRDHLASRSGGVDWIRLLILDRRLGHLSVDIELLDAVLNQLGVTSSGPASRSSGREAAPRQRSLSAPRGTASRRQ